MRKVKISEIFCGCNERIRPVGRKPSF